MSSRECVQDVLENRTHTDVQETCFSRVVEVLAHTTVMYFKILIKDASHMTKTDTFDLSSGFGSKRNHVEIQNCALGVDGLGPELSSMHVACSRGLALC